MIIITTNSSTIERALAISQAMTLAGYSATPIVIEESFNTSLLPAGIQGLLALDPEPKDLDQIKSIQCNKVCLYTTLFDKAPSVAIAEKHAANNIAHIWERIRPATADYGFKQVLLPPPSVHIKIANDFFDTKPYKSIIGIMMPPLETTEAVAVENAYLDIDRPKMSLAIFKSPKNLSDMTSKLAQTSGWFIPDFDCSPIWSFEMTAIMLAGARIACSNPPGLIRDYIFPVRDMEGAIKSLISSTKNVHPDPNVVRDRLTKEFISKLTNLDLFV